MIEPWWKLEWHKFSPHLTDNLWQYWLNAHTVLMTFHFFLQVFAIFLNSCFPLMCLNSNSVCRKWIEMLRHTFPEYKLWWRIMVSWGRMYAHIILRLPCFYISRGFIRQCHCTAIKQNHNDWNTVFYSTILEINYIICKIFKQWNA